MDSVPGYVYRRVLSRSGEISYTYISPSILRILGLPEVADGTVDRAIELIHRDDRAELERRVVESARTFSHFLAEFRFVSAAGQDHWFRSEASPRRMENGDTVWDGLAVEITREKLSEAKVEHLAYHDPLTGLPNRLAFNAELSRHVSTLSDNGGHTAVFSIDLDTFQTVNDTLGGTVGDKVLRRLGLRLREFAEPLGGLVARLGGDEFAVLLPGLATDASGQEVAEAIGAEIRRPMMVDGEHAVVEACIGAAVLPRMSDPSQVPAAEEWAAELLSHANQALQVAKSNGLGVCRLYSAEFDDQLKLRSELRKTLGKAIAEEQFTLHYQPIVDLMSGEIIAAEALLRWDHPKLGLQRPDLFIPIAEASGQIVPIGAWVIKAAMAQAEVWKGEGLTPVRIAVNVSSIQLRKPGFMAMVKQALADTGADAHQFDLEITEGVLLHASGEMRALFEGLRQLGFSLVIDDFGTGHATFGYLRDHVVDKLKIDQVFVRHLSPESSDAAIIRAMIALCHSLNLKVVAEGIETRQQHDFLLKEGCMLGQGYLFSLPLRAEDFGWMLRTGLTLPIKSGEP